MEGHAESDFEATIDTHLLGHGWLFGSPTDFDVALGLDPVQLVGFVQVTQPQVWAKLTTQHGAAAAAKVAKRVAEEIDAHGVTHVLRRGVKDSGQRIQVAYFRPTSGLTPELSARYAANRVLVYRQLHHSETNTHQSLDLVLAVNGIPVITAELKNQFTGQSVEHAMAQYRDPKQRNPADCIFARRAMAHFAVDPDLVYVTTRLTGPTTVFLPFNQGSGGAGEKGGRGNPINPAGHRTAFLWEQVWARDTLLDLLHRYVQEKVTGGARQITFPRYHQWDAVEKLTRHAAIHGAGHHYLLEHSAGSGKSNSIAWLAHRLADLHTPSDTTLLAADAGLLTDQLVFDKVVVITDRTVLDQQLQQTISGFDHVTGLLKRIDGDSQQLRAALDDTQTKIIITTLQKFPVIKDATVGDRRVAVIVDEAHSSQSGDAAQALKKVLGEIPTDPGETEPDDQDTLAAAAANLSASARARGRQPNVSFFAFTATPKGKTLQLFGRPDEAEPGKYRAFHLYSMRQAIEERFILDVLADYVTYKRYYRLANGLASDDPEVEKGKAAVALARFVDLHPTNLDQRAEIVVEHFRTVTAHAVGGQGKAMVVTKSRLHAVRYQQAITRYLKKKQLTGIRAVVAFSGSVTDPDNPALDPYTEANMNGFPELQTKARFHDEGHLLIVAEKYQTGYDEPLLHTMYVDKKLEGVKAVQTLSRLNRIAPGKDAVFVLDFVNTAAEMKKNFVPFYESSWTEETDPNLLYNLQTRIDGHHVIHPDEQAAAVAAVLAGSPSTHASVSKNVDPAVDRAHNLPEHEQADLRDALGSFLRAYAFLGQVVKFTDEELESLFLYGKLLASKLKNAPGEAGGIDLGATDLSFVGHKVGQIGSGSNTPDESDGEVATFVGTGRGSTVEEALMIKLSELIQNFNQAFGIALSEAETLLIYTGVPSMLSDDETVQQQAADNTEDQFTLTIGKDQIVGALWKSQEHPNTVLKAMMENDGFADALVKMIGAETYRSARRKHAEAMT